MRPGTRLSAPRYGNDVKPRAPEESFQAGDRPEVGRGYGVRELFHPGAFEEPEEEGSPGCQFSGQFFEYMWHFRRFGVDQGVPAQDAGRRASGNRKVLEACNPEGDIREPHTCVLHKLRDRVEAVHILALVRQEAAPLARSAAHVQHVPRQRFSPFRDEGPVLRMGGLKRPEPGNVLGCACRVRSPNLVLSPGAPVHGFWWRKSPAG